MNKEQWTMQNQESLGFACYLAARKPFAKVKHRFLRRALRSLVSEIIYDEERP